jgi:hypothetical protein
MKKPMRLLALIRVRLLKELSIILFTVFVLAGPLTFTPAFGEEGENCAPPYKPSNIFKVIFNYSKGMEYISTADSECSDSFADELVETFRDSMFITQGCLDVTIDDVEEAKAKRSAPAEGVFLGSPPVASLSPVRENTFQKKM